jgi:putative acetyltransferase
MHVKLRPATLKDCDAIRELYLAAFPAAENRRVAQLAMDLVSSASGSANLNLLAVGAARLAGHVAFSVAPAAGAADPGWTAWIMGPLAVAPDLQRRGIGRRLIEAGVKQLQERGVNLLFVYGDPGYYGRFGFSADAAAGYRAPYTLTYPLGWQLRVLHRPADKAGAAALTCVDALSDPALW